MKLTQVEAAKKLGITQPSLYKNKKRLITILKALNYSREDWSKIYRKKILTDEQKFIVKKLRKHYKFKSIMLALETEFKVKRTLSTVIKNIDKIIFILNEYPKHQAELLHIRTNQCILNLK